MAFDSDQPTPHHGPRVDVSVQGATFTLLGTAHVSRQSAAEVREAIASGGFDAVAIELDPARHAALKDKSGFAQLDLWQAWRSKKLGMVAVSLALGAFQQRLADQFGIEPGAEMRAAIEEGDARGLPLWLIDRDLGVTLRRVMASVPWWQRANLLVGVVASLFSRETIRESDIERLKEGDVLSATFAEFAESDAHIFGPLIRERDTFMAARLLQELAHAPASAAEQRRVLVVIGAGHLKGLASALSSTSRDRASLAETLLALQRTPPAKAWTRLAPWLLVLAIVVGFAIGFSREPALGWQLLLEWTIINGGLAGLGALIALAHPLTIVGTALAAPLTSLNPLVGAGFVAAGIELALRRPRVGDLQALRRDVVQPLGWWRNRAARALLVFALATLGSALGTYLAGFRIVERLL